ncbi:unnamed protein product [[Actinomadura] parvosata subsp. kistnae]|nr:unnamed protein product [Actinomadura parvosata subsp. kistnae]
MIDFRYHLVSIVAIFLALAVGIVLGTTLLQGPAVKSIEEVTAGLTASNDELRAQIDSLRGREAGNDQFIISATGDLVSGDLTGQRVLLVETPGSSNAVREASEQVLDQAGAEISGRVALSEKFFDPRTRACSTAWSTNSNRSTWSSPPPPPAGTEPPRCSPPPSSPPTRPRAARPTPPPPTSSARSRRAGC